MADEPNTGGPAFPVDTYLRSAFMEATGMTLRDYFAAQTLAGLITAPPQTAHRYVIDGTKSASPAPIIAELAYELADAMLVARSSKAGA